MNSARKLNIANLTETQNKPKISAFRQTRHDDAAYEVTLTIEGARFEVRNWSRTGIAFEISPLPKDWKEEKTISNVAITTGNINIFSGNLTIMSIREQSEGKFQVGARFLSSLLLIEGIESARAINQTQKIFESDIQRMSTVRPEFCHLIVSLRMCLKKIQAMCKTEESRWKQLPFDRRIEAERVFLPNALKLIGTGLDFFNIEMSKLVDVDTIGNDSALHDIVESEIYPFVAGGDATRRSFEKPLGYAGDYEMMNQMYRSGYEGDDLFGKLIHNHTTNVVTAEAVKFRKSYFISFYKKYFHQGRPFKVLSIASGPAIEVQELVKNCSQDELDQVSVTLFDLDREALEHAQTKVFDQAISMNKQPNVHFINASVKSFLHSNSETHEKYDLIYSGGLFDYLDQTTSTKLVQIFSNLLNPGGTLVIGNFTKENYSRAFLHLLTRWSLIYKTPEEVAAWANGIPNCRFKVEFDKTKVNAFLVLTKNENS